MGAEIENSGARFSQLAIQGPKALGILQRLTKTPLGEVKYYWFTFGEVNGVHCMIARTGYTGEDGFEIYFQPAHSEKLWNDLMEAGTREGMLPCGLGARNTLRLEAGMCLYGHEIDETTTVLEAGLGWICKLNKPEFLGRDDLIREKAQGLPQTLIGFEMLGRQPGRDGCTVMDCRKADWPRDERVTSAISKEEYWDGIRATGMIRLARKSKSEYGVTRRRQKLCRCRFTRGQSKQRFASGAEAATYKSKETRCIRAIIVTRSSTNGLT